MADVNDPHFNKIFWYIAGSSMVVFAYIISITFLPIPKENQRFVDICLGFLLGTVLGGGYGYLVGGTPPNNKKSSAPGNTSAEITATITSENKEEPK